MNISSPFLVPFIFDCDGVLVDSERLAHRIAMEQFLSLGLNVSYDDILGKAVKDIVQMITERTKRDVPPEWIYQWAISIANGFIRELQPVSGIQALLDTLKKRGHLIGVASQSQLPRIQLSLHVTGLEQYFDKHIYSASMVAKPKPSPDIFLYAAASMGVDPSTCIVVEDSPLGVQAACAAGMKVYGYAADQDAQKLREAGAHVFHSMHELLALLLPSESQPSYAVNM
ncbi:MAG: HAD family phosphatase [Pseudomonadota bacterium]